MTAKTTKPPIDWEAVELQYRAGVATLKTIGKKFGVTDAGIIARAKRLGWTRDLSHKIRERAKAKVSEAVSPEVSAQKATNEEAVIEQNASAQALVLISQRKDIQRGRKLAMSLLDELEFATGNVDLMMDLGELMRKEDDKGQDKLNELYRKVVSLSGRVSNVKQLSDTLKTLVGLEREAFGIDERTGDPNPQDAFAQVIAAISSRGSRLPTGAAE